jgi:hypothetical protein
VFKPWDQRTDREKVMLSTICVYSTSQCNHFWGCRSPELSSEIMKLSCGSCHFGSSVKQNVAKMYRVLVKGNWYAAILQLSVKARLDDMMRPSRSPWYTFTCNIKNPCWLVLYTERNM